ncbi:MAG TPA: electron transfer flavoprotein subunit alpha/FixB family protein [Candidatus Krumholzibacteria bacterium]|nr:electron transfer flavoprotein subunit alpha/FixB family protein [Candidatus Krumholzibacteria bacterium]
MPNIAVFIEQRDGALKKVAWQMISEARRLADAHGGEVWGVFLGTDAAAATAEAAKYGADKVYAATGDAFAGYDSDLWGTALAAFCKAQSPDLVLVGSTALGKDLGPKTAAKLGCACISDAVGLTYEGGWEIRRPVFAGKCFADLSFSTATAIVGIRPNAFVMAENAKAGAAATFDPGLGGVTSKARVTKVEAAAAGKVTLTEAEIVVSGGRGIKGPENYPLIEKLAEVLGAAAGASRAIVDAGWVDYSHQVGQTGKTVAPKLYIACGISGAIQHLAGMSSSKCIVAINKDANAPIFKVADYGVVADLFNVVPVLTDEIGKIRS